MKKGWTQKELAGKVFVSVNTITQYETGARNINSEMLENLCRVMEYEIEFREQCKNINIEECNAEKQKNSYRVMIINPSSTMRMFASCILKTNGHKVCEVSTFAQAAEMMEVEEPDAIISEIWAEDAVVIGVKELEQILLEHPNIPIMLTCCYPYAIFGGVPKKIILGHIAELVKKGAKDVIGAPFENSVFMKTFNFVMEKKKIKSN